MARDTLFDNNSPIEKFEFNERVADVFDDMLSRSVPFYKEVIEMTAEILGRSLQAGDTVYDLGCSTGTTLIALARKLEPKKLKFINILINSNAFRLFRDSVFDSPMPTI